MIGAVVSARAADAPDEAGEHAGLAYARFRPARGPRGGILILHGAGSRKENHFDFASAARDAGFEAVTFDARGHGATGGKLDGRAIEDVVAVASLLPRPLALRGSSMGGYFALVAGAHCGAEGLVAVCPASAAGLSAGLRSPERSFAADVDALDGLLADNDAVDAASRLAAPLLIQHAEGDEVVPIAHSRALLAAARTPHRHLVAVPGGHHRSVQHDPRLQAQALEFLALALAGEDPRAAIRPA
jgi:alpha-beta hydrolase superfamily lysophospholipase